METVSQPAIVIPVKANRLGSILSGIAGAVLVLVGVFVPYASSNGSTFKILDVSHISKDTIWFAFEPLAVGGLILLALFVPLARGLRRGALFAFGVQTLLMYLGYVLSGGIASYSSFAGTSLVGLVGSVLVIASGFLDREMTSPSTTATAFAPQTAPSVAPAVASPSDTKTCPRCAETVKTAAQVCRFCGHMFAREG